MILYEYSLTRSRRVSLYTLWGGYLLWDIMDITDIKGYKGI